MDKPYPTLDPPGLAGAAMEGRQKREWLARRLGLAPEDVTDGMVFQAKAGNSLF